MQRQRDWQIRAGRRGAAYSSAARARRCGIPLCEGESRILNHLTLPEFLFGKHHIPFGKHHELSANAAILTLAQERLVYPSLNSDDFLVTFLPQSKGIPSAVPRKNRNRSLDRQTAFALVENTLEPSLTVQNLIIDKSFNFDQFVRERRLAFFFASILRRSRKKAVIMIFSRPQFPDED